MFISTKTFTHEIGLSCAFRQWRANSHCNLIHGYAIQVRLEFAAETLDDRNWVVDFGGLKEFKSLIQQVFDHKLLVAGDDPMLHLFKDLHTLKVAEVVVLPDGVGCEKFAAYIAAEAAAWLFENKLDSRVWVHKVEVSEHGANSAMWVNEDQLVDRIAGKIAEKIKEARNES